MSNGKPIPRTHTSKVRRLGPTALAVAVSAAAGMSFPLISGILSWRLIVGGALLAALITFVLLIFENHVYDKRLRQMSVKRAILLKSLVYAVVITACYAVMSLVARNDGYSEGKVLTFQSVFTFALVLSLIVSSVLSVSRILGQHELIRLVLGRYHQPREEERVLMFVDLAGSTAVAEKIGAIRFFKLLNDFFHDLMDPILGTHGEVYKYVGDEVIVTWSPKRGLARANCLDCFFRMQEQVESRHDYYMENYGIVPEFRAGLHFGRVVIGEMGDFKREIAILGDTVNTTARIVSEAAARGMPLLVSEPLVERLDPKGKRAYRFATLGEIKLKGKEIGIHLLGAEEAPPEEPRKRAFWKRWFSKAEAA
jgi:adenylate cyclase